MDTVLIQHNFTGTSANYSMSNISSGYYYNYTPLAAGTYVWKTYANDTSNNINSTDQWTYTVSKASTTCSLTFTPSSPSDYGTPLNVSCSCTNPESTAALYRNGTDVTAAENNQNTTLAAGSYSYVCNTSETQNYTSSSNSSTFKINKLSSAVNLTLNSFDSNISVEVYSDVNATASRITGESTIQLYRQGTLINSGTTSITNTTNETTIGTINYTILYPSSQNYSSNSETHFVTVVDNISPA